MNFVGPSIPERKKVEELFSPLFTFFFPDSIEFCSEHQVLPCRKIIIDIGCFMHDPHLFAGCGRFPYDIFSKDFGGPCSGRADTGQETYGCGLSRTVWAEETECLTFGNGKTDIVQCDECPEMLRKMINLDRVHTILVLTGIGFKQSLKTKIVATSWDTVDVKKGQPDQPSFFLSCL